MGEVEKNDKTFGFLGRVAWVASVRGLSGAFGTGSGGGDAGMRTGPRVRGEIWLHFLLCRWLARNFSEMEGEAYKEKAKGLACNLGYQGGIMHLVGKREGGEVKDGAQVAFNPADMVIAIG